MIYGGDCWLCRPGISTCWWDMVAGPLTPVSPTGGGNSCRHSSFQILCSCRGYVTFHNQPKGSQVLASSLSSDSLNVSGGIAEVWHQGAHGSGCCVWVRVDDHISDPFVILVCGHQTLKIEAFRTAVVPDFCLSGCSSLSAKGLWHLTLN